MTYPIMLEYIYGSNKDPRRLVIEFTSHKTGMVIISESGNPKKEPDFQVGEIKNTWTDNTNPDKWKPYYPTFKKYKVRN